MNSSITRIFGGVALFVVASACVNLDRQPGFPDRETEHRITRAYDSRPATVEGGESKVTVYCRDGTRFNVPRYNPSACADYGGIDYYSNRD